MNGTWPGLRDRIHRQERQRRIARFLFRLFRLDDIEPIGLGEYAVVAGYVTLWNDVRPVVEAAQALRDGRSDGANVVAAVERYEALYPDHAA